MKHGSTRQRDRPKIPESEKITINLGFVDLGQIDLLVSDGFYAYMSIFIRTPRFSKSSSDVTTKWFATQLRANSWTLAYDTFSRAYLLKILRRWAHRRTSQVLRARLHRIRRFAATRFANHRIDHCPRRSSTF